jgi:hypothetical protein
MKKIFFGFLLLFAFSNSRAQIISEIKQLSGLSISSVYFFDDRENGGTYVPYAGIRYQNNLTSFSSGFQIGYLKHKFWQLNTRIYYLERGGSEKLYLVDYNYERTGEYELNSFSTNYLSLNTTFEIKHPIKSFTPYIFLGPRYDYFASSSWDKVWFNKNNFGFDIGTGIEKTIKEKYLIGIDLLYSHQFRNITNERNYYKVAVKPQKGITVLLCLGLIIGKK